MALRPEDELEASLVDRDGFVEKLNTLTSGKIKPGPSGKPMAQTPYAAAIALAPRFCNSAQAREKSHLLVPETLRSDRWGCGSGNAKERH